MFPREHPGGGDERSPGEDQERVRQNKKKTWAK
jgi:hypothetical protein